MLLPGSPGLSLGGWFAALFLFPVLACAAAQAADADWLTEWDMPDGFTMKIDTEGYDFPAGIAFVPNPGPDPKSPLYFVAEMRGALKVVTRDRSIYTFGQVTGFDLSPIKELPSMDGEAGMASVALDPAHGYVFVSFAYYDADRVLRNAMARFSSTPGTFGLQATGYVAWSTLFKNEISRLTHQIGTILIDGNNLFVGVADGGQHYKGQSLDSTLGKILRMSVEGDPVADNPFYEDGDRNNPKNYVWAMGLRNPFGLALVKGRIFVTENGFRIDRFLEVRRGENCGWNGTDWSIGMNAPMVIGPTVCPVHLCWLPPDNTLFPERYRSKFFIALAGGVSGSDGLLMVDYDFEKSRLAAPPQMLYSHVDERNRPEIDPVDITVGPDALYMVTMYAVRRDGKGKGGVIKLTHDAKLPPRVMADRDQRAEVLMIEKGCYSCHGRQTGELNIAPALDRQTLIPRILARLQTRQYKRSSQSLDELKQEPFVSYREARHAVLAASGREQVRLWLKYHIMEPQFDQRSTAMPNLGVKEPEAAQIADHLIKRNIGGIGASGVVMRFLDPYLYGPATRKHMPGAFAIGFVTACGMFGVRAVFRRPAKDQRRGQG